MAKRGAITDLNHDNWDQEEPDEEAGIFKRATDADLSKRVFKKATRRLDSSSGEKKPVFGNFSGFGQVAAKPASATFSFLNTGSGSLPAAKPAAEKEPEKPLNGNPKDNYSADLKQLNLTFVKWITECVEKTPLCILTPVFDDYRKYVKELDDEKKAKGKFWNILLFF